MWFNKLQHDFHLQIPIIHLNREFFFIFYDAIKITRFFLLFFLLKVWTKTLEREREIRRCFFWKKSNQAKNTQKAKDRERERGRRENIMDGSNGSIRIFVFLKKQRTDSFSIRSPHRTGFYARSINQGVTFENSSAYLVFDEGFLLETGFFFILIFVSFYHSF